MSAALERLKAAAIVVGDILDAGERDPRWVECVELEQAAIEYARATREQRNTSAAAGPDDAQPPSAAGSPANPNEARR